MLEDKIIRSKDIIRLANFKFDVNQLIDTERYIIDQLNGVIYRTNLYTSSFKEPYKLVTAFTWLRNCFIYPYMDLDEWRKREIVGEIEVKDMTNFGTYYKMTEYYGWETGTYATKEDYVLEMYEYDKERCQNLC